MVEILSLYRNFYKFLSYNKIEITFFKYIKKPYCTNENVCNFYNLKTYVSLSHSQTIFKNK